ncbi:MAG: hypothetical protein PSN44_08180 [Gammaproteobacteria bacterium]|nr:hypothetical protein [Gammaproteobacteria bacterium]
MSEIQANTTTPKIIYILVLANIIVPLLGLIGVVMAYVNKDDAPEWLQTHYQFQIRTFWIGLLYVFVGALLSIIIIGWFIILFTIVWIVVRCIKGMKALDDQEAHPNPTGWMFS